jgi:hypothetical protein
MRKPSCLGEGPNHEVTALGTPVPQRSKAARFRIALHISSLDDAGLLANYKEPLPHAIHGGWDTWWVWDARLTSVLLLFLIYLGLVALWRTIEDPGKAARAAAIFTLVGAVNIPIIKFSVDWWNTLHQPASVFRLGGPAIAPSMLWPLIIMALAFTFLFVTLHLMAIRNEILRRRLRRLLILAAGAQEQRPAHGSSALEAAYEP